MINPGKTPSSRTTEFVSTSATIAALGASGLEASPAYATAAAWLNAASADNTMYLAERIGLLNGTSYDVSADIANLNAYMNNEGAYYGGRCFRALTLLRPCPLLQLIARRYLYIALCMAYTISSKGAGEVRG